MLKKILAALAVALALVGNVFAAVEVNSSDQAALDGVKGIGPATSKAILEERKKGGNFKDWADLENRVKGIKEKKATALSEAGLTVNGQPRAGASAKGEAKKEAAKEKANAKKEAAKDKAASASAKASAAVSAPADAKKGGKDDKASASASAKK